MKPINLHNSSTSQENNSTLDLVDRISALYLHNSSTSQENNSNLDLVDRISALPDLILGLILSNIPTKDAVATTILSKRWKFVWLTVHNLDFCFTNCLSKEADGKFIEFVNRVLLLLEGELVNKFSLVWMPKVIPIQVSKWIDTAITRNVHHLYVSVWSDHTRYKALEMPNSFFTCVSLQSVVLTCSISFSDPEIVVCLPKLETLKLESVDFKSEEVFEKLISGCPMLNYLYLYMVFDKMKTYSESIFRDFTYIISSTSLRRLELDVVFWNAWCTPRLKLKEASSLEYFKLVGNMHQVYVQGTLSSLVEADFRIHWRKNEFSEYNCNSVVEVVRAFDCAKDLTLSMEALWDIGHLYYFDEDQCDSNWIPSVEEVPICFSSLKEISFYGYVGLEYERKMIAYILKHGTALEVMQVHCRTVYETELWLELVKEIFNLPRSSQACKIEII